MKRRAFLLIVSIAISACQQSQTRQTPSLANRNNLLSADSLSGEAFIPRDSANKMISSYLNSINSSANDSDIRSVILDADALRACLATDSGHITHLKVMFAHNLDYINSGKRDVNCGYSKNGLTVVIAGYDAEENYVYLPGNLVMNHALMCPAMCPVSGSAKDDLLLE